MSPFSFFFIFFYFYADGVCQKRPRWAFLPIRQLADTYLQFCGLTLFVLFNVHGRSRSFYGQGGGGGGKGRKGGGGKQGGDNINYLVKIITENKVFHFLRNWKFLSASDVCQIPFLTFISWFGNFFSLSASVSPSLCQMKRKVGRYVSEESNCKNWITQSEKSLATLDCFGPYLVNVATKQYCSICLETAFISKEFGMKILMVVAAAED